MRPFGRRYSRLQLWSPGVGTGHGGVCGRGRRVIAAPSPNAPVCCFPRLPRQPAPLSRHSLLSSLRVLLTLHIAPPFFFVLSVFDLLQETLVVRVYEGGPHGRLGLHPKPGPPHAMYPLRALPHATHTPAAHTLASHSHAARIHAAHTPAPTHAAHTHAVRTHAVHTHTAHTHAARTHTGHIRAAHTYATRTHTARTNAKTCAPYTPNRTDDSLQRPPAKNNALL